MYENALESKKKKDFYTENISLSTLKSNHPKAAATILETISITDSKAKKDDNTDLEIDTTNIVFLQKEDGFKSYTFKVKQEKGLHYFRNIIITDSPDKKTEVLLAKFNLSKKLEDTQKEGKINKSVVSIESISLKNFKVKKSITQKSNSYGELCIQIGHWAEVDKCEGNMAGATERPDCYEADGKTRKTVEVFIVELSGCSSGGSTSQNNGGITVGTPPTDYNPSTGTGGGGDGNAPEFLGIFIPNPYEGEAELTNPDFVFSTQVNYFLSTLISGNYGLTNLFETNNWITPTIVQFLKKEGGLTPANKAIVANALNNFIQIYNTDLSYMSDVEKNIFLYNTLNYFLNKPNLTYNYFLYNRTILDTNTSMDIDNNVEGGYDTNSYADFNPQQTWSTISPVIPTSKFVGWDRSAHPSWQCMEYSKEQLRVMGYKISNYSATGQTFQIYTAQNGVNNTELTKGLSYLKYALSNNIPVIVGVDNHSGSPNPKTDNTTDHFIVIVGMGQDSNGKYFQFYDNASGDPSQGANSSNKLYYNSTTGIISGSSMTNYAIDNGLNPYKITMIRKSKPL